MKYKVVRRKNNPTRTDIFVDIECPVCNKHRWSQKQYTVISGYTGICYSCSRQPKERFPRVCPVCKRDFFVIASSTKNYCSHGCFGKHITGKKKNGIPCFGDVHWNWKGGITGQDKKDRLRFRKTIQRKVFIRDSWTCKICGIRGVALHVDHINSWSDYPEQRFEISNCRTLCIPCHYRVTYDKEKPADINWCNNSYLKEVV